MLNEMRLINYFFDVVVKLKHAEKKKMMNLMMRGVVYLMVIMLKPVDIVYHQW